MKAETMARGALIANAVLSTIAIVSGIAVFVFARDLARNGTFLDYAMAVLGNGYLILCPLLALVSLLLGRKLSYRLKVQNGVLMMLWLVLVIVGPVLFLK